MKLVRPSVSQAYVNTEPFLEQLLIHHLEVLTHILPLCKHLFASCAPGCLTAPNAEISKGSQNARMMERMSKHLVVIIVTQIANLEGEESRHFSLFVS